MCSDRIRMRRLMFVALLCISLPNGNCNARIDQQSVQEVSRDKLSEFPWYDEEKHDITPVNVRKTIQPKTQTSWEQKPRKKWNWNWNWGNWGNMDLSRVLQACVWIALILLVGGLLYFFIRSYINSDRIASKSSEGEDEDLRDDVERMENLPFPVRQPNTDLLAEARRHYESGNFAEGIIYLFSYQLVQLDKHNLIRLTKGKTNRQYVRELSSGFDLRTILSKTMLAFEDVFFGDYPLRRERFESCWHQLDDFHRLIEQASTA